MARTLDRVMLRVERFLWFAVASLVGGAWVFFEPMTGREVPGHAHPVFATLLGASLVFGGIDLSKVARVRRELLSVAREAGLEPSDVEAIAHRVAVLEVEDPQVVRALQALAPRAVRQKTDPQALTTTTYPRQKTEPGNPRPRGAARKPKTHPDDAGRSQARLPTSAGDHRPGDAP